MKLTDTACKNAKPVEKSYKRFDGGGLYLEVMPNGNKLWRLKYRFLGLEKRISLGAYPVISLAEAREGREEAKKLLAKDVDPSSAKRERRHETFRNAQNTFKAVAMEWHEKQKDRWSKGYADKVTIEALAEIKNPRPVAFIRQQNVGENVQVNNGTTTPARAGENSKSTNGLLEDRQHEQEWLDTGTSGEAGGIDRDLEAMAAQHRTKDG